MRIKFHPPSAVLGALVLVGGLAAVAFASPPQGAAPKWEYKIVTDPSEGDVRQLAKEGWEYAGYLGRNVRGASIDDVLWQRAK